MEPLVYTPTYEVFLVLPHARAGLPAMTRALEPLAQGPIPSPLGADVYYRKATDIALLAIRFDERQVTLDDLTWLAELAEGAGVPLLDPTRLKERDRRRFYDSYLRGYELVLEDLPAPIPALAALGHDLDLPDMPVPAPQRRREADTEVPIFTGPTGFPVPPTTPPPLPRAVTEPPLPPRVKGRRLGSPAAHVVARLPRLPSTRAATGGTNNRRPSANRLLTEREPQTPPPARDSPPPEASPADGAKALGKQRARTRRETTPATPIAKKPVRDGSRKVANGSGPHPVVEEPAPPPEIDVRYLRGSEWVPARLRSLSLRGAYLVTGALPRAGDTVHIALGFRGAGAMISGNVYHVTTVEDAAGTGSSGFAIRFPQEPSTQREQLVALLRRARAAGVTIKPPPARVAVRFPVHWPVRLGTRFGGITAEAQDVSTGGMFLVVERELPDGDLRFQLPLDNDDAAISGRARTVRRVTDQMAMARGLSKGYGLLIVELSDLDERRWTCFLERVRRRSERRVVIGARGPRFDALMQSLTSAGYVVSGAGDAAEVLRLAAADSRPPDGALIDSSLLAHHERRRLESALAERGVRVISSAREEPARARAVIDRMLGIGS